MFDPLSGILAFAYLIIDEIAGQKKANEYLKQRETEKAKDNSGRNFQEPHRDPKDGKIIIENSQLYHDDVLKYGAHQAQQWVKQGKYNLSPEELEKEKARIKANYDYLYKL